MVTTHRPDSAAGAFVALLLLRFGFGFAQSGAYPTAASIISKWMPLQARGRASGIIAVGGRVGGFLALSATGYILIWLTPLSTPTELASSDILDGSQVVIELTKQSDPVTAEEALRGRCFAEMNGDVHELVLDHDQHPSKPLASEELSSLAEGLNQIIRHPGFFTAAELKGVSLEKEAKRLIAKPTSELTEQQSQRLNRLVLEAASPKEHQAALRRWMATDDVFLRLHRLARRRTCVVELPQRTVPAPMVQRRRSGVDPRRQACRGLRGQETWRSAYRAAPPQSQHVALLRSQWFTNIGWVFLMTWARDIFSASTKCLSRNWRSWLPFRRW